MKNIIALVILAIIAAGFFSLIVPRHVLNTLGCAIINFEQKLWACQPTLKFKMLSRKYQATWPRPLAHTRWGDVPFRDCPTFFRSLPHLHLRFLRATADYNRFFAKDLQATNLVVA
jgi:hypothetical protein